MTTTHHPHTGREFDPFRLTEEVIRLGEDWADKEAAASSLEESKKTLLASISLDYIAGGVSGAAGERTKAMPVTQAELRALADIRYTTHLELMVAARKEAQIARVRYDMGRMRLELIRSQQATLRNEMRMSGIT